MPSTTTSIPGSTTAIGSPSESCDNMITVVLTGIREEQ